MTPPLGPYGDSLTPPLLRQGRRAGREATKQAQRALTASVSSALCHYSAAGAVTVDLGASLTAHVSGIHRCGSPWACLLCAPTIRERRAVEIDQALAVHLDRGGSALFVTLTLRHRLADVLEPRLAAVSGALGRVLRGSGWERRRDALGYVGSIRAVEVTDGGNGWHPHNHSLFLFDRMLTPCEVDDFGRWLFGRWEGVVTGQGFGDLDPAHGVDVRPVHGAGDLAGYLCKVEGGWGAGLELARSDLKRSSPLSHLFDFAATGDMASASRWVEYEQATFGKRALRWSAGLRALLLGNDDEVADADLAASEGADLTLMRALIDHAEWNAHVRVGRSAHLLSELEQVGALLLMLCPNPQPLEVPCGELSR